jgi:simple sugar transport system ATP-binding protein
MAASGVGVLLVTSDLDELLALSDRVVVMFGGRIVARLENSETLTPDHLGPFMLGLEDAA